MVNRQFIHRKKVNKKILVMVRFINKQILNQKPQIILLILKRIDLKRLKSKEYTKRYLLNMIFLLRPLFKESSVTEKSKNIIKKLSYYL